MRDSFIRRLTSMAESDPRVMLITGDLGFGVFDDYIRRFPRQFLNAGVAEQNMTGLATGLALEGRIVFTYSIANFVFEPAQITVAVGQSVTWTNNDGAPHGLKFNDGAQGMELMLPGQTFTRSYAKAGTYDYACAVHPYMTGRVIVRAP